MTKSELIEALVRKQTQLGYRDVELAVKTMLEHMAQTLASGERIEIRGFGSFSLHYRPPRERVNSEESLRYEPQEANESPADRDQGAFD